MEKEALILKKSDLHSWVDELRNLYSVYAPVKGKMEYNFREIDSDTEFDLEYVRTIIPPKKFLHPQREKLVSYRRGEEEEWILPEFDKKTIVLGVHPCDARAILVYDTVFGGDLPDAYYLNRRKNTIIVAVTCSIPDEDCFCVSWSQWGPTMSDRGYDLLMTDIGDSYMVEIGSTEGSLLVQNELLTKADADHRKKKEQVVAESKSKIKDRIPDGMNLPALLNSNYDHDAWDVETAKCVSCGTCTLVCPTCFCYHVDDFNRWNLKDGERMRIWDSCQLIDFAEVAMGENFRKDRGARLKWRIYHKLAHWPEQFGTLGCTGCGRCMHYCIADIDMTEPIARIRGEKVNA